MVTPNTPAAAPARSLVEFDADTLRHSVSAYGVQPSLSIALGLILDAIESDTCNIFTDAAINGAALVESNQLALVVARGLIGRLQADLNAAAIEQRAHLRDELARFEQMNLE
jgi:hypothetical protein